MRLGEVDNKATWESIYKSVYYSVDIFVLESFIDLFSFSISKRIKLLVDGNVKDSFYDTIRGEE